MPLLAAADVSGLPTRFEHLPMRFPLPALSGATSWQGEVAPDESFDRVLLAKSARGETLTLADLPNGDYVLRLRAVDGNGLQGFDAAHIHLEERLHLLMEYLKQHPFITRTEYGQLTGLQKSKAWKDLNGWVKRDRKSVV